MILLELAAQGLRGAVPANGRAALRAGYVVLRCEADVLRSLLRALLWADEAEGAALRTAAGHAVRAGCTFSGVDRGVYRLVSDLAADVQLQRYDSASRTFSAVAGDRAGVQAFLADRAEIPSRSRFEALLCVRSAELPSRAARSRAAAAPPRAPPADADGIRAHLAELRGDLERSRAVDELQRRIDGCHARAAELDEVLQQRDRLRGDVEHAEARLRGLEGLAAASAELGDVEARLASYERASARREEAEGRISEERSAIAASAAAPPPAWKVPQLWAGIGAGVAALAAGLSTGGATRYVALLDVPAFGWAAWTALGWVGRLESSERAARRARVVDERERKMLQQWEDDAAAVRRAMVAAGAQDAEGLRRALRALDEARVGRDAALDAETAWLDANDSDGAQRERAELDVRLAEANGALTALSTGFVRDVGTLEAEIARLEGELASAARHPSAVHGADGGDPVVELARAAAHELGGEGSPGLARVRQRTGEILASVSGLRVEGLWDGSDARAVMPSGRTLPLLDVPPEARDLCWVALKLALLEHELETHGGVALVDGAADGLPLAARRVAAHVLKRASRTGQVLHVTAEEIFREAADLAV